MKTIVASLLYALMPAQENKLPEHVLVNPDKCDARNMLLWKATDPQEPKCEAHGLLLAIMKEADSSMKAKEQKLSNNMSINRSWPGCLGRVSCSLVGIDAIFGCETRGHICR